MADTFGSADTHREGKLQTQNKVDPGLAAAFEALHTHLSRIGPEDAVVWPPSPRVTAVSAAAQELAAALEHGGLAETVYRWSPVGSQSGRPVRHP